MPGPLVLLGWADITQMLNQVIHPKAQPDALPLYVPASTMPRVREVQSGLNESLGQMPQLEPVVLAPTPPNQCDTCGAQPTIQQAVPEGFQPMPVEPSLKMLDVGWGICGGDGHASAEPNRQKINQAHANYAALLRAAKGEQ
jgi:hypothetical protein